MSDKEKPKQDEPKIERFSESSQKPKPKGKDTSPKLTVTTDNVIATKAAENPPPGKDSSDSNKG